MNHEHKSICEILEPRTLLAGVTILTHGYNGNIDGWVSKAADDIAARAGGNGNVSEYVLSVGKDSNNHLAILSYKRDSGYSSYTATGASEIIVKLDWSTVSDGSYSTADVGDVVGNYLLNGNSEGIHLAALPIQLIGHSRGASLMTQVASDLGKAGVWVDQQTNLDPHPVDGVNDFLDADFGDTHMATYDNVAFSDTYWRTDGDTQNFDFDGEAVSGSHNSNLQSSVQAHFIGSAHGSVPSYYDGTIDVNTYNGGDTPIQPSWYAGTSDKPARDATGFLFSRIVYGARPSDGLWSASGGTATRTAAGESGSQWANVADLRVLGSRTFRSGDILTLRYIRQDRDGGGTISLLLDRDNNPFNNNFVRTMRRTNIAEADNITATRTRASTEGTAAGRYWVCAKIVDSAGHVRYAYSSWIKFTDVTRTPLAKSTASDSAPAQVATSNSLFATKSIEADRLSELD